MINPTRKILIVEDEMILAVVIRKCLEKLGYTVLEPVNTGEQAIEAVKEHQPDLILMDITINGNIDGIEAMEVIRTFSDVAVIYITGNSAHSIRERAARTHMSGFMVKPVEDYDLEYVLEQLFAQPV